MLQWILVLLLAATPNPCMKCHKDLATGRSIHKIVQACDDCHEATDKHKFVTLSDEDIIDQCTTCHDEIQPRHPRTMFYVPTVMIRMPHPIRIS